MLAKLWPSSCHKVTQNGAFGPLSEKVFMQSNSNLVCIYTFGESVQNSVGPRWPNFGPLVATKLLKMVVVDHYLKKYS